MLYANSTGANQPAHPYVTRIISYHVAMTRRDVVEYLPYIGALCRSKSYAIIRLISYHVIMAHQLFCDGDSTRERAIIDDKVTRVVRQCTGELRDRYEKRHAHCGQRGF